MSLAAQSKLVGEGKRRGPVLRLRPATIAPVSVLSSTDGSPPLSAAWSVEETAPCFIVRHANGQALAFVYCEDDPGRRATAKLLTRDEARRIAAGAATSVGEALGLVTSLATRAVTRGPGRTKTVCRASSFTIIIKAGSLYPLSFRSSRIVRSA
jgi:hypothetical protein